MGRSSDSLLAESDGKDKTFSHSDKAEEIPKNIDLFRDTPIRYLGYANEVGEAFRAQVCRNVVRFSYVIACSYVCADAYSKGQEAAQLPATDSSRSTRIVQAVGDTLLWQGLASVAIPGFTINRICYVTGLALGQISRLPAPARKWSVTMIGLAAIPVIIKPIDRSVDYMMENTVRKWFGVTGRLDEELIRHKRK